MFKKVKNNKLFLLFLAGCFLVGFSGFCSAADANTELEVGYPILPTGTQITSSSSIPQFARYFYDFGMILGLSLAVLSLVAAGVLFILSSANPNWRARAMDLTYGALTGLLLLSLTYLIAHTISPELTKLKIGEKLPEEKFPNYSSSEENKPGVHLYAKEGCDPATELTVFTNSQSDLGVFMNIVKSVKIVQGLGLSFVAILHSQMNFQGRCYYINPNGGCYSPPTEVKQTSASLSVYPYNFEPSRGGVTFYRKPLFDKEGGYYKVSGGETKNNKFIKALDVLTFKDVPEEEQICVKWDTKGIKCLKRVSPTLAGKNISGIKIEGNYLVLLLNYKPLEKTGLLWSNCQVYPPIGATTESDFPQIRWDYIRNVGDLPNWVIIIPVS